MGEGHESLSGEESQSIRTGRGDDRTRGGSTVSQGGVVRLWTPDKGSALHTLSPRKRWNDQAIDACDRPLQVADYLP